MEYGVEFYKTYNDFCNKLERYGTCNMVRPTSFGKTTVLMKYAKEHPEKKCIIVEPRIAKIKELKDMYKLENTEFATYSALSTNMYRHLTSKLEENTVVFFDESHRVGSKEILENWDRFIEKCRELDIKVGGCSNNEIRTDGMNVTHKMFNGIRTYEYNLDNAVSDGNVYVPKYYAGYGWLTKSQLKEIRNKVNDREYKIVQRASKVGHIIKDVIEDAGMVDTYYKFIIFYDKIDYIKEHENELKKELEQEFNGFTVNVIPISSDIEHRDNDELMLDLKKRQKTIDVLLAVNKLTEAFHLPDLTGIVMLRKTGSHIVYTQQLGRAMTSKSDHKMLAIDIVGNIDADFSFDSVLSEVMENERGHSKKRLKAYDVIEVNVTAEQEALRKVISKVISFRGSVNLRNTNNIIKIYTDDNVYNRGENIIDIANAACFGYEYDDVYNILNTSGRMREADRIENITKKFIREANGDKVLAWKNWYTSECSKRKALYNKEKQ